MPSKNTKKKLKQAQQSQQPQKVEEIKEEVALEQTPATTETTVVPAQTEEVKQEPKQEQKTDVKDKKKKEKKPSKIKTKAKELSSELKKVTWATFGQVAKKTAVVLAVVAIFAVVLLGIDKLLELFYNLLIGGQKG